MPKHFISGVFVSLLLFVGCAGSGPAPVGPEPIKRDVQYCSAAEAHLQELCNIDNAKNKLCCDMVRLTPKQRSFEQVCQSILDGGIFVNPQCIATVTSCEQVDNLCMQNDAGGNK